MDDAVGEDDMEEEDMQVTRGGPGDNGAGTGLNLQNPVLSNRTLAPARGANDLTGERATTRAVHADM